EMRPEGILQTVKEKNDVNYGFDAASEKYTNMIKSGIVDPTKVCRSAIQNSASVAALVLTTESLVADLPEPPQQQIVPDMNAMGGMGMY
ncbi:MAG: molecular chaperone GroEL, partial [Clostridia bacterium]|nr:molecular chaperone GroEL [Clostridia bacterium]